MDSRSVRYIQTVVSRSGEPAGDAIPTNIPVNRSQPEPAPACAECGGSGWRTITQERSSRVTRCECTLASHMEHLLTRAKIPARYSTCELANYDTSGPRSAAEPAKL